MLYYKQIEKQQINTKERGDNMYIFQQSFISNCDMLIKCNIFHRTYYNLFKALDLSCFPEKTINVGRTGYSRHAMFRAFIVKHREEIKSVPRLIHFLESNPALAEMCGFTMGHLPDSSQFYRFLKEIPNSVLQKVHLSINKQLIDKGAVTLDTFIMDSKPVMAATKENNNKNPGRNIHNKNKKPRRNPQATLGYYSHCEKSDGTKTNEYFWGYRTHTIVSIEGIPLVETTLPNNKTDVEVAIILINKLKRLYKFKKDAIFIGDASYDVRRLYELIVNKMKCQAFIPANQRNTKEPKTLGPHGAPICDASLEMSYDGLCRDRKNVKLKFRCPLKTHRAVAAEFPDGCPINHFRFFKGAAYGCTKYIDVTDDARSRVHRKSKLFKKTVEKRIVVEQYFSRLGDREVEQTTHYKLRPVKNQMTIAHLSQSLVALAAVNLNRLDKMRCFRTFAYAC